MKMTRVRLAALAGHATTLLVYVALAGAVGAAVGLVLDSGVAGTLVAVVLYVNQRMHDRIDALESRLAASQSDLMRAVLRRPPPTVLQPGDSLAGTPRGRTQ